MSKCIGCGVKLQTEHPDQTGYIPSAVLLVEQEVYCKRCHDIRHHNKRYDNDINLKSYYDKIGIIKNKRALVILIIDILDIYSGFVPNLYQSIGKNEVLILVNKVDVLPKKLKVNKILKLVENIAVENKLSVIETMAISAKNDYHIDNVVNKIAKLKYYHRPYKKARFDDCYVVGCSSVGKSTFINAICEKYLGEKNRITTSDQFQTTIDFIKVPLDDKNFLIDTPGVVNYASFLAYLEYDSVKILMPKTYIKVRTYQLQNNQTIFLGGLVRIDFISGENISASFFVSNDLYIHRTKQINAEKIYQANRMTGILVPPYEEKEVNRLGEMVQYEIIFNSDNQNNYYDLLIPGLGFIHLTGQNVLITLHLPQVIKYHFVESFI